MENNLKNLERELSKIRKIKSLLDIVYDTQKRYNLLEHLVWNMHTSTHTIDEIRKATADLENLEQKSVEAKSNFSEELIGSCLDIYIHK